MSNIAPHSVVIDVDDSGNITGFTLDGTVLAMPTEQEITVVLNPQGVNTIALTLFANITTNRPAKTVTALDTWDETEVRRSKSNLPLEPAVSE